MGDEHLNKFKDLIERGNCIEYSTILHRYRSCTKKSHFIAAHSMGTRNSRPESNEILRALGGQHEKYDLQHVREQLSTPEMQGVVEEIQAKIQLMERLRNGRPQNGSK